MTPYRHRIVVALDLFQYAEIVLSTDVEDVESMLAALVVPALDGLECRWSRDAHRAPDRMRLSTLVDPGGTWAGAGLLW